MWEIVLKDGDTEVKGAYNVLKYLYTEYWTVTAQGWDVVVYVSEVNPDTKTVVLKHGLETPSTFYTWTRDYNSPRTIVWRFSPMDLSPDEDEPEDEDAKEEFREFYTDAWASREETEFAQSVMETAKEICEWEGWECPDLSPSGRSQTAVTGGGAGKNNRR